MLLKQDYLKRNIWHIASNFNANTGLNERQIKAVLYVKEKGKITNKEYQEINQISKRTAVYELVELLEMYKIFKQKGESVSTYYEIL
jgi:ATP-dependent DNA helicase RecG